MYAVLLRGSEDSDGKPKMIGSVGIPRVSKDAVEVGYGVNPEYWGMGYGPEAVKLFIQFYWNTRGKCCISFCKTKRKEKKKPLASSLSPLADDTEVGETKDKIIAYTAPDNIPSSRVLEKNGFQRGEVKEKAYEAPDMITKEMRWYPAIIWSLERPTS